MWGVGASRRGWAPTGARLLACRARLEIRGHVVVLAAHDVAGLVLPRARRVAVALRAGRKRRKWTS